MSTASASPTSSITHGPIGPALTRLAWPVIAGEALHVAFHLVDIAWVRPLGSWATAAIMTSMFTLWLAFAMCNLVGTGLAAHVARAIGSGERGRAGHALAQALWLAIALSVVATTAGILGARPLFQRLSDDPQVQVAGAAYLSTFALGMPFLFIGHALQAALRACGNTRLPLLCGGAAVIANMALAPFFIFGWGPFPEWGVRGSAVATVICMGLATGVLAVLAWRGHADMPLSRAAFARPNLREMGALAKVGAPHASIGALFSVVYLVYARIAGADGANGAAALAVLGIGNRLESVTYLTADGFGTAAATFVGQNLGAGNPDRAERSAWTAARVTAWVGMGVGLVMLAIPGLLLAPFAEDPAVVALGIPYVRVLALCQITAAVEGAIGGAFAGAGDTIPPMTIHVAFAVFRIPAVMLAAPVLGGLMAVAWTMSLTCIVRGTLMCSWFRRGAWKRSRLDAIGVQPLPQAQMPAS